ncbi:MAG: hypothetical protein ABIH84_01525 [bacterium]
MKVSSQTGSRLAQEWTAIKAKADGAFKVPEDFLALPFSDYVPSGTQFPVDIKHVVVLGIGGSSLATKAVYEALSDNYQGIEPVRFPQLHFLEQVDASYINRLMDWLSKSAVSQALAFVIVSRSGKTFELLKNLDLVKQHDKQKLMVPANTYVISVPDSYLWDWGKKVGAKLFPVPQAVSGRFQVFGPVSVVPLGLAQAPVASFVEGAKHQIASPEKLQSDAGLRWQFYQEGLTTDVYFVFDERLRSFADWLGALTAESLGKAGGGITPMTSVGSRDNHAMLQLYLQGRRDKFTTFISLSSTDLDNLTALEAVKKTYDDARLPYVHVVLNSASVQELSYDLGSFMQGRMIQTVLLGSLLDVNPYDQPGVQLYKKYLQ